jgi:glycerol transport system permease protein
MRTKYLLKYLVLFLVVFAFVFPVYYMVVVAFSLKDPSVSGSLLPDGFLGNWNTMFTETEIESNSWPRAISNSLMISVASVVVTLLISFPAGYVFSRYNFPGDKHLLFFFLITRMAPIAAVLLPYLIIFLDTGLFDTIQGLVIAYLSFNVPIAVWLFTSFMGAIPKEVDDSAFTDGYSIWRYFWRVFIPLNRPAIGVVAFFVWYQTWSEMFLASILTRIQAMPLNANMFILVGRSGYGMPSGIAATAGVITMIPGMILLFWARNYLSKGFTFGRI